MPGEFQPYHQRDEQPALQRTFATEKEAFDVWHAMFHAHRKLRK
jgi:hypothetical protein